MAENTPPLRDYPLDSETPVLIAWPLTVDNTDTNGGNALTPLASSPIVPGVGFVANGYDSKLFCNLPAWACVQHARISVHVIAKLTAPVVDWREVIVDVSHATEDKPKLELCTIVDPNYSGGSVGLVALRTFADSITTTKLNRFGWRFEFRSPEQISGIPKPQALCWLDANTLIFVADISGTTKCALYKVDATTGEYIGRASSTTYRHPNSLHVDPDGEVWTVCSVGGFDKRKRIDLSASFSTGNITESGDWNTGDVPTSSIAFATIGGVGYVLLSQYANSGTPCIYVFLRSQMAGTVNQVNRVIKFRCGLNVQDLVQRASDGLLYISRSLGTGGQIQAYDLAAIIAAGVDDVTPTPVLTYPAATKMAEGLDFRPSDDRLWMCTEGEGTAGDLWSHSSLWSSSLTGSEENAYLLDFEDGDLQIRINGRLFHRFAHTPGAAPTKLSIGASPNAFASIVSFVTSGTIRSLAIKSVPFTPAELSSLA